MKVTTVVSSDPGTWPECWGLIGKYSMTFRMPWGIWDVLEQGHACRPVTQTLTSACIDLLTGLVCSSSYNNLDFHGVRNVSEKSTIRRSQVKISMMTLEDRRSWNEMLAISISSLQTQEIHQHKTIRTMDTDCMQGALWPKTCYKEHEEHCYVANWQVSDKQEEACKREDCAWISRLCSLQQQQKILYWWECH